MLLTERLENRAGAVGERERSGEDLDDGPAPGDPDRNGRRRRVAVLGHRRRLGVRARPRAGGARLADDLEMGFHPELLVRVLADRAVDLVRSRLERQRERGTGPGLDHGSLLFGPLAFDLQGVRDASAVGDGKLDRPGSHRRFRQLDGPLGQPGADRGGRGVSRERAGEGAGEEQPGGTAGRGYQSLSHTRILTLGWQ